MNFLHCTHTLSMCSCFHETTKSDLSEKCHNSLLRKKKLTGIHANQGISRDIFWLVSVYLWSFLSAIKDNITTHNVRLGADMLKRTEHQNLFLAKITKPSLWSNLPKNLLIWLNPRFFMPCRNRLSDVRDCAWGIWGESAMRFFRWDSSLQISVSTNDVVFLVGFWNEFWLRRLWNLLYRWSRNRGEIMSCHAYRSRKLQAMTTKLIYMLMTL